MIYKSLFTISIFYVGSYVHEFIIKEIYLSNSTDIKYIFIYSICSYDYCNILIYIKFRLILSTKFNTVLVE